MRAGGLEWGSEKRATHKKNTPPGMAAHCLLVAASLVVANASCTDSSALACASVIMSMEAPLPLKLPPLL